MLLFGFDEKMFMFMAGGVCRSLHHLRLETSNTMQVGTLAVRPVTIATFYRWLDIIDDRYREPGLPILLRKITLEAVEILTYVMKSVDGPPLPRDSGELLEPGVYAPFLGIPFPLRRS
jgi:hypothetical protein